MFWIWLAAAVVFLIIELLSPTFFFICFTAGAVVSGVFSYFYPEAYYWQIGIFIVVSLALLFVVDKVFLLPDAIKVLLLKNR